jgi:hypothetical protein
MGQQWRFEQDDTAQWRWVYTDGEIEIVVSSTTFPNQIQCMMDAMRYVVRGRRPDARLAGEQAAQPH